MRDLWPCVTPCNPLPPLFSSPVQQQKRKEEEEARHIGLHLPLAAHVTVSGLRDDDSLSSPAVFFVFSTVSAVFGWCSC